MNSKQAKQIPIEVYLERLGHKPKIARQKENWYISPLREEKTASFKVNKFFNIWYDHGWRIGGDIINLVMYQFNTNVSGALKRLENAFGGAGIIAPILPENHRSFEKKDSRKITAVKPLSYFPLISYLRERKIDIGIAKNYLVEVYYKSWNKSYFSLGFQNDLWWYEIRNSFFKGSFSPKTITTLKGNDESKKILLFEGFLDFLSYLSYIQKQKLNDHILVLNSVAMKDKAVEKIRELKPAELHFYFDNDKAGETAKEWILKETGLKGVHKNTYYAGFKDLNDFIRESK